MKIDPPRRPTISVMAQIPHNSPWITQADQDAVARVLASGQIAQGPEVEQLEREFTKMLGGGAACAVSSGTAALFLALRGLGVGSDDLVALPTYACSALLNAVFMLGASARLIDIRDDDLNINADLVPVQAKGAKAAIAVHCFGAAADIDSLVSQDLKVVVDCCQYFGESRSCQGTASVYSFYATKIITGGQGGLVWDHSGEVAASVLDYRQFDCRDDYIPRFNFQMTDIQAALARSQFSRLGQIKKKRRALYTLFSDSLPVGLSLQDGLSHSSSLPYRFVVRAPDLAIRDRLRNHMADKGVTCIVPVERYELLHRYLGLDPADFPIAEKVADTSLSIPIFPAMSEADAERIARALGEFR